ADHGLGRVTLAVVDEFVPGGRAERMLGARGEVGESAEDMLARESRRDGFGHSALRNRPGEPAWNCLSWSPGNITAGAEFALANTSRSNSSLSSLSFDSDSEHGLHSNLSLYRFDTGERENTNNTPVVGGEDLELQLLLAAFQ